MDAAAGNERFASKGQRAAALGAGLLALLHGLSFLGSGPIDDDYIVYRYAANWAAGLGPVFNAGERVEGFTVPLWTLVHTAGARLGSDPVLLSLSLGLLGFAVAAWALARAWFELRPEARWPLPALVVALTPAAAWHAVAGLGTTWMIAFVALWLAGWLRVERRREGRPPADSVSGTTRPGLWIGLGALLRPELLLFALPYAVFELRRRRPAPALLALVPVLLWFGFRWSYYGALTPVSLGVKRLDLFSDLAYGARYFLSGSLALGLPVLLVLAFDACARRNAQSWHGRVLRVGFAGALASLLFVVAVGGDFVPLARFFLPCYPVLVLLAALGLATRVSARSCTACVALGVLLLQVSQGERAELYADHRAQTERWVLLGREFDRTLAPDASIATAPVGAIGYYAKRPIVDLLGRTHRAFLELEPDLEIALKGHHRHSAPWVLDQKPDVIVLGNGLLFDQASGRPELVLSAWERDFLEAPDFASGYRAMQMPIAGSYRLIFFLRAGADVPLGATPAG